MQVRELEKRTDCNCFVINHAKWQTTSLSSLGTSLFADSNHVAIYETCKTLDLSRPIHYEGDADAGTTDMYSYMYPDISPLIKAAFTKDVAGDGTFTKPICYLMRVCACDG